MDMSARLSTARIFRRIVIMSLESPDQFNMKFVPAFSAPKSHTEPDQNPILIMILVNPDCFIIGLGLQL